MILPPNVMTAEDVKMLRENDLCVVVAKDPARVKFVDPIPAASSRTQIENAAIQLSRKLLTTHVWDENTRRNVAAMYIDLLVKGTPLDPNGTKEEQEQRIFDEEKRDELRRLAKEEAKAERAAAKQKALAKPENKS